MLDFLAWLFEKQPQLATALVCIGITLFAALLLMRKGWLSIGRPRRIGSDVNPDSGRRRAFAQMDAFEEHEVEMADRWKSYVEARARHRAANLIQETVFPRIDAQRERIDRMEPVVAELKSDAKEMRDSVGRLEERVVGVKESLGEVKAQIGELDKTVSINSQRTHEMIGQLLKRAEGKP